MSNEVDVQIESSKEDGIITLYSSLLSVAEIGLGSILHALHIPFRGHFLSLNQTFLLTRALQCVPSKERTFIPLYISSIAASVKALAPVGKKLTPMLAIAAQGFLYNVGIFLFRNNFVGKMIGATLAALWGFLQPFLIYYLIFGQSLIQSLLHFNERFTKGLFLIFVASCVGLKILFVLGILLLTPRLSESSIERYMQLLSRAAEKVEKKRSAKVVKERKILFLLRQSLKDICRPLFLLSLFLTTLFLYFAHSSPKWIVWGIVRPIAVGFIFYFILRLVSVKKIIQFIKRKVNGSTRSIRDTPLDRSHSLHQHSLHHPPDAQRDSNPL
jgi:hypothetical protein